MPLKALYMDKEAIKDLASDNQLLIKKLYHQYRAAFLGFGQRYNLGPDDLADIYQEAFIALRKHAINGKLNEVKSSMKTYLFGIGKYMIFNTLKARKAQLPLSQGLQLVGEEVKEVVLESNPGLTKEQQLLRKYFKELGEKCQQVLTLFYYRGLSINEIALKVGYENANVVKAHKSRCLKSLREKIKS